MTEYTSPVNPEAILQKAYWSYDEIIELAIFCYFSGKQYTDRSSELVEFKAQLLRDLRDAILCRAIVPVDLVKSTWYQQHIEAGKYLGAISALILTCYVLQKGIDRLAGMPGMFKTGADTAYFGVRFIVMFFFFFAGCYIIMLLYLYVKRRSRLPRGKVQYLAADAHIRGFTEGVYESDTAIDFLNARYFLKLEKDPFRVWKEPFFKKNGNFWIVGYMGKRLCLKEKTGLETIAYLLSNPNAEFDCMQFVKENPDEIGQQPNSMPESDSGDEYKKFCRGIEVKNLDKNKLESLLEHLKETRSEAQSQGNTTDLDECNDRIKMIEKYICLTFTKDGKERPVRDNATKSKDAVKKAVERCIADLKKDNPFLAEHLSKNITRSYTISYHPPENINWDVQF